MKKRISLLLLLLPFILFILLSTISDYGSILTMLSPESLKPNLVHLQGNNNHDSLIQGEFVNGLQGPIQVNTDAPVIEKTVGSSLYHITPRAKYSIHAQVAAKKLYSGSDNEALAPVDLALIWGRLTTPQVRPYLTFSMPYRRAYFYCKSGCPENSNYLNSHMSNNHIIPADDELEQRIKNIEPGQVINMTGYLVNVMSKKGTSTFHWRTSMTRTDFGMGACEVFYVETFSAKSPTQGNPN